MNIIEFGEYKNGPCIDKVSFSLVNDEVVGSVNKLSVDIAISDFVCAMHDGEQEIGLGATLVLTEDEAVELAHNILESFTQYKRPIC